MRHLLRLGMRGLFGSRRLGLMLGRCKSVSRKIGDDLLLVRCLSDGI